MCALTCHRQQFGCHSGRAVIQAYFPFFSAGAMEVSATESKAHKKPRRAGPSYDRRQLQRGAKQQEKAKQKLQEEQDKASQKLQEEQEGISRAAGGTREGKPASAKLVWSEHNVKQLNGVKELQSTPKRTR